MRSEERVWSVGFMPTKRSYLSDTKGLIIANIAREMSARTPRRE